MSGLTPETFQNGGAAFLTLAGYNTGDLGSKLATTFGSADGKSFLLIAAT